MTCYFKLSEFGSHQSNSQWSELVNLWAVLGCVDDVIMKMGVNIYQLNSKLNGKFF